MNGVVRFSYGFPGGEHARPEQALLEVGAEDITYQELLEAFERFSLLLGFSKATIDSHLDIESAVQAATESALDIARNEYALVLKHQAAMKSAEVLRVQ